MPNDLVTQEAMLPTTDAPADFRARLDEFWRDREMRGGRWTLSRLPSPAERKALDDRGKLLASRMRPMSMTGAEMSRATSELAMLIAGYPNLKDRERTVAAFVAMLKDLPLFAVQHACALLREGKVDDVSPEYPPTAPLIYKLAREHAAPFHEEQAKCKSILSILTARDPAPPPRLPRAQQVESNARVEEASNEVKALAEKIRAGDRDQIKSEAQAARDRIEGRKREQWAAIGREPMYERDGTMLWPSAVNFDNEQGAGDDR